MIKTKWFRYDQSSIQVVIALIHKQYIFILTNPIGYTNTNYCTLFIQLRALDWDVDGPLQNSPAVIVYHPEDGNQFANVGWAGWIATISGER